MHKKDMTRNKNQAKYLYDHLQKDAEILNVALFGFTAKPFSYLPAAAQ